MLPFAYSDSKHTRLREALVGAFILYSCDNGCGLQVCGLPQCVYLETNLKGGGTGRTHNKGEREQETAVSDLRRAVLHKLAGPSCTLHTHTGARDPEECSISTNTLLFILKAYCGLKWKTV